MEGTELLESSKPGLFSRLAARLFRRHTAVHTLSSSGSLPLSIEPNPDYFVESPATPFRKIVDLIERSDGGVFAITGVRGAGKSVLLNTIAQHFESRYHTLTVAAPVSTSHELEFFMTIFRRLCDSVTVKLRRTVLKEVLDLRAVGRKEVIKQQLYASFLLVAILLGSFAFVSNYYALRFRYELLHEAQQALVVLRRAKGNDALINRLHLAIQSADSGGFFSATSDAAALSSVMTEVMLEHDENDSSYARPYYPSYFPLRTISPTTPFWITAAAVASYIVARVSFLLFRRARRYARYPTEIGLLVASANISQYLDYELTQTRQGEISFPFLKGVTGKLSSSQQLKSRSITLPSLTAQYIDYTQQLLQVFPDKLVICVDELDKVTDIESVRSILREIKGGLYVKGCFYLVSLSEDALQAFGSRLSVSRDIFESTFDEIIPLDRLTVSASRAILLKRLTSVLDIGAQPNSLADVINLCATLSAGVPRDLIRNFRECILETTSLETIDVASAFRRLFKRKIEETTIIILNSVELDEIRAELLGELSSVADLLNKEEIPLSMIATSIETQHSRLRQELTVLIAKDGDGVNEGAVLKSWVRSCIELRVYVAAGLTVMGESEKVESTLEQLRRAYSILPYSTEFCETVLEDTYPDWPECVGNLILRPRTATAVASGTGTTA